MIIKFEGIVEVISPIHHGGNEKTGSTPILRTIMVYHDGELVPLPYVSGNALRGKLRRLIMRDFLYMLDLQPEELGKKLYHVLFTGGVLESTDDTAGQIDLSLRMRVRELLPPLSLLGGAIGNQMVQGKLKVGHLMPLCLEYKNYLPDRFKKDPRCDMPVRVFTDESFRTRRDELKADREEYEQAVQMKVDFECFIPGTGFYHWWALEWANDLEKSCFGRMIELFKESPYVGGMSGTGYGEVRFDYGELPQSRDYMQFVLDNRDKIISLLAELRELL